MVYLMITWVVWGENAEADPQIQVGYPFITQYSAREFGAYPETWKILQDKRGVMFFGNESGIVEFDGQSWRTIQVPYQDNVRSFTLGDDGVIYVCAANHFGYLQSDSLGKFRFISLNSFLDDQYQSIGEIWDVAVSSNRVFYKTRDKILIWDGKAVTVIDSVNAFRLYKIGDTIYSRNHQVGLMIVEGDSVRLMPGGEFFKSIGVYNLLDLQNQPGTQYQFLVTTNSSGLFLYDGRQFHPFKTDVDSLLKTSQIYNACILPDGNYALATQRGGVFIVNPQGKLVLKLDETAGLPTNVIYDVFPTREGGLWLATNSGIVLCNVPSPFSIFKIGKHLKHRPSSILRFHNTLFVANDFGVQYLDRDTQTFKSIKGINKPGYDLLDVGEGLLVGSNWGLIYVNNFNKDSLLFKSETQFLLASQKFPNRIYAGTSNGLTILHKEGKNTFKEVITLETEESVYGIVEEKSGNLWLAGNFNGIYYVHGDLSDAGLLSGNDLTLQFFDKQTGLPGSQWMVRELNGKLILDTDQGLFLFDDTNQSFITDTTFGGSFPSKQIQKITIETIDDSTVWLMVKRKGEFKLGKAIRQTNDTYEWSPIQEFQQLDLGDFTRLYAETDPITGGEVLWISTPEAFVRFQALPLKQVHYRFQALIRKVTVNDTNVVYWGNLPEERLSGFLELPYSKNNINFEYAGLNFVKPQATQYQIFLEGNDAGWSQWRNDPKKYYTNLSQGEYTFRVRARNVYGVRSNEAAFSFIILPPWYFTWWAWSLYGVLVLVGIWVSDRIGRRIVIRAERNKARLREAKLVKKQAEELETVDKLVRVINEADNLETLFNSLLEKTVSFIPQAQKAALFIRDPQKNSFYVAHTCGYQMLDLSGIALHPDELANRYIEHAAEVEPGIYIIQNPQDLPGAEKFSAFQKPTSMLIMAVEREAHLDAYVVFDSFEEDLRFDVSAARILGRLRVHAVSAISKASHLKMLQEQNEKILKTREQLITQEKLASLGQLTAGIAHEIKNPLNFIVNFANISLDLLEELTQILKIHRSKMELKQWEETQDILTTLRENGAKIQRHGKRADNIIHSMLQHSREKAGEHSLVNINTILEETFNLVYHGFRARNKLIAINVQKHLDPEIGMVSIIPQDVSRVFLNILQNAFYALTQPLRKATTEPGSSEKQAAISTPSPPPEILIQTRRLVKSIEIKIRDNGAGIPEKVRDKIFNPFFTTKPTGEGTGLGLSIAYEIIVKDHKGEILCSSVEGEFTEFIIRLPIS